MAPAVGQPAKLPKPPDPKGGTRRPQSASSSPSGKGDRDTQHAKKKVKDTYMADKEEQLNVWTQGTRKLFERLDDWYVADSDSEDVAEMTREEDDELDDEEFDTLCPSIQFTAAEKSSFRREWRSALVVKGFGRKVWYLPLARRLNQLWGHEGALQISDLNNGCYLVRFRERVDYEREISGGPWLLGDTYLTVPRWYKGFNPWKTEVKSTILWVQLPDLPIDFYHRLQ
ncbi:hypothetical protein LINGRAHAP2_LOCUS30895 [Linum grandiflorum]